MEVQAFLTSLKGNSNASGRAVQHRKKRILAVDDDGLVRRSLELLLKEPAMNRRSRAAAGALGISCPKGIFDLLITDIRMPGMDGLQVIRAVRDYCGEKKRDPIPEIVLTAYNDESVLNNPAVRWGSGNFFRSLLKSMNF